jgi:hypothetical protein
MFNSHTNAELQENSEKGTSIISQVTLHCITQKRLLQEQISLTIAEKVTFYICKYVAPGGELKLHDMISLVEHGAFGSHGTICNRSYSRN